MITRNFNFKYTNSSEGQTFNVADTDTSTTPVVQRGQKLTLFSTRLYDVRWAARRLLRLCNRRGIPCFYFSSFYSNPDRVDHVTGSVFLGGTEAERDFRAYRKPEEANMRIGYMSPIFIKVLHPNYTTSVQEDEKGQTLIEEAEITLPMIALFKRWDRFKILDKNYIAVSEAKLVYDNKGFVEGQKITIRSLRPSVIET
jgi:hypothetical protein